MFYLIFSIVITTIICLLDFSYSSLAGCVIIYAIGLMYNLLNDKENRQKGFELFNIVYCVYILVAYIFSQSFSATNFFLASDPMRYITRNINLTSCPYDWNYLLSCYTKFTDSNALYNIIISYVAIAGNNLWGGSTIFYLTLLQSLFGILTICSLYRLLLIYFDIKSAFKYSIVFGLLSIFLFYSSVILRDIIIAFFFVLAFEIILKKFKARNAILLLFYGIIVWGIRLYSGLFYLSFFALYLFLRAYDSRIKSLLVPAFVILLIWLLLIVAGSTIISLTENEISVYSEMTLNSEAQKEGLFVFFYKLPPGIRQIAIFFYSQMAPFPPYSVYHGTETFSNFIMATTMMISAIWWTFIFYSFFCCLFYKQAFSSLSMAEKYLLILSFVFIMALTSHPDVRRMMPVYPILYVCYLKIKSKVSSVSLKHIRSVILFGYLLLIMVYTFIKI
jgi:hypothetical protein